MLHKLLQTPGYRHRFIFDWDLKIARSLNWVAASDVGGLSRLLDNNRPVVFFPGEMFADLDAAFSFFCRWCLMQAERLPGKFLVGGDESQEYITTNFWKFPQAVKELFNYGRNLEIDTAFAAQRITDMPSRIRGQMTEIYVFKHCDTDLASFDECRKIGIDPDAVKSLPHPTYDGKVGWIYRHCLIGKMERVTHEIDSD